MEKEKKLIYKYTEGVVKQIFDEETGELQEQIFIASDRVDYEDENGKSIDDLPRFVNRLYAPFEMCQPDVYLLADSE